VPLTAPERRAFTRLADDLRRVFGGRFVALVATGGASSVAFASSIGPDDLEALSVLTATWHHERLEAPLLLSPEEFRRSLDTFPVEYQTLLDAHEVIAGRPPFDDVRVDAEELRRACEAQARSHLIHLRQGWMTAAGHDEALAHLIARSSAPLAAVLRNVARLQQAAGAGDALADEGARLAGLPQPLVRDVLAVDGSVDAARALVPRLGEYVGAAERLWRYVDEWRA